MKKPTLADMIWLCHNEAERIAIVQKMIVDSGHAEAPDPGQLFRRETLLALQKLLEAIEPHIGEIRDLVRAKKAKARTLRQRATDHEESGEEN